MPSIVKRGDIEPEVQIDVVLLAPVVSLVFLCPGSCHDQEFVLEAGNSVAMSGVLQVVSG